IIGIALILAVSQGTTGYINHVQESTLASYPLTIQSTSSDLTTLMETFMSAGGDENEHGKDAVYNKTIIGELVNALVKSKTGENDLKSFKSYLDAEIAKEGSTLSKSVSGLQYTYDMNPLIYTKNIDGKVIKSDANEVMAKMIAEYISGTLANGSAGSNEEGGSSMGNLMINTMSSGTWQELLKGNNGEPVNKMIKDQYEVVYGDWPNDHNEVVLVLNKNHELDDLTLYALGLISQAEIDEIMDAAISGKELDLEQNKWSYEEICSRTYRTILPADCYKEVGGVFVDFSKNESGLNVLYENGIDIKVKGIIRPKETTDSPMLSGAIGYTHELTEYIITEAHKSPVVQAQLANPTIDVLTGLPFKSNTGSLTEEEKQTAFLGYVNGLTDSEKAEMFVKVSSVMPKDQLNAQTESVLSSYGDRDALENDIANALAIESGLDPAQIKEYLSNMSEDELKALITPLLQEQIKMQYAMHVESSLASLTETQKVQMLESALPTYTATQCALYYDEVMVFSDGSLENNLKTFGAVDLATPHAINIYATTFDDKEVIENCITSYNDSVEETKKIKYTDYVGLLMGSVTQIIDAVTYVLIAFVAISLIVSSIMIGVITLISVQERTKEIGVLRAIGASKKDVSSMFNAETIIIGFSSGMIGVLVTYLLCIPINIILRALTGLATLKATLPIGAAVILVVISMLLTLISGIIPSRSASKKDPVVALRTE
ncbi:MAG: ABC transporter permease, partial [Clostridia bacterium]|nr:ABC transporter permease [Clostridia bacterium]